MTAAVLTREGQCPGVARQRGLRQWERPASCHPLGCHPLGCRALAAVPWAAVPQAAAAGAAEGGTGQERASFTEPQRGYSKTRQGGSCRNRLHRAEGATVGGQGQKVCHRPLPGTASTAAAPALHPQRPQHHGHSAEAGCPERGPAHIKGSSAWEGGPSRCPP